MLRCETGFFLTALALMSAGAVGRSSGSPLALNNWSSCVSPVTYSGLPSGSYTFKVGFSIKDGCTDAGVDCH